MVYYQVHYSPDYLSA